MSQRRPFEEINLSFLDVICCGFGAIILLLMITKISLPLVLEETIEESAAQVAYKELAIEEILGEIEILERAREESEQNLDQLLITLSTLMVELEEVTSRFEALQKITQSNSSELFELTQAKQSLTDEMQRLISAHYVRPSSAIGGITVDSEYIIFVIDTSGSMQLYAWNNVVRKLNDVLNAYPNVIGIQVLNDDGRYMFPRYQGQWIKDSPARRQAIIERLRTWDAYSDSNPVDGIEIAIDTFYDPNKRMSIYYFGDDFAPTEHYDGGVEEIVRRVDLVNTVDETGARRVRIHAVGFPVYFDANLLSMGVIMFSNLMRELTVRNGGTFVGLPAYH